MLSKNIKYYRLMRGMSQDKLAESIGHRKMTVSNYENGKRSPDVETIRKIADVLQVPMARLLVDDGAQMNIQHGAFRKQAGIGQHTQELILGFLDRYLARLFNVVRILGDASLAQIPQIERVKAVNKEEAAQHLRSILGLPPCGPIGNITDILENNGYIICPIEVESSRFSGNSGTVNGRPYIAVNANMPAERQRFTLIHELAHLVFFFDEGTDEERMVDGIAGAFLLPASDIKRELGPRRTNIIGDLRLIQKEYQISMSSINIRAYQTDIISKKIYDITNKWLSAKGYRKDEHSGMKPEKSHMLEQLTLRAVAEEEIGISKAAELLERPFEEVRKLCYGGV